MALDAAGSLFRRLAAPAGRLYLRHALAQNLPAEFEAPVAGLLTGRRDSASRQVAAKIESLRAGLARRPDVYVFENLAAGHGFIRILNTPPAGPPATSTLSSTWVANTASVPPDWGLFLHQCARSFRTGVILELGSCAGISGCYLASAPGCRQLITIEGSPALAALAESTLRQVTSNFRLINEFFDQGLDRALEAPAPTLDLVFIDGHHEKAATLHYFDRVTAHLRPGSLIVFDDICLYQAMWEAWEQLCRMPGIARALNLGRFGLCQWDGAATAAQVLDFSRFTGIWRVGGRRKRQPTWRSR